MLSKSLTWPWTDLNARIVACRDCARLVAHCQAIGKKKRAAYREWDYWSRPVPNFGDPNARVLLVGLAPGAHGSNRTGRMFTGDASGVWLYRALHKAGFASQPNADHADDELKLIDCAITSSVHCAPPDNMPTTQEKATCRRWLDATIDLSPARVFVALGGLAWGELIGQLRRKGWHEGPAPKFGHEALVELAGGRWLLGSYHPSQQNTSTGRLTEVMLDSVFKRARRLIEKPPRSATRALRKEVRQ
ncbi:MAG TPA: uracil-DNA glycosylase [Lacipirellula sp.]